LETITITVIMIARNLILFLLLAIWSHTDASDGASVADNEDHGHNVLVRESLVTKLFQIFYSLIPAKDGAADFASLVRMKNDFWTNITNTSSEVTTLTRCHISKYFPSILQPWPPTLRLMFLILAGVQQRSLMSSRMITPPL